MNYKDYKRNNRLDLILGNNSNQYLRSKLKPYTLSESYDITITSSNDGFLVTYGNTSRLMIFISLDLNSVIENINFTHSGFLGVDYDLFEKYGMCEDFFSELLLDELKLKIGDIYGL
jgi:hypothetical protein